jgi:hypothetical protein
LPDCSASSTACPTADAAPCRQGDAMRCDAMRCRQRNGREHDQTGTGRLGAQARRWPRRAATGATLATPRVRAAQSIRTPCERACMARTGGTGKDGGKRRSSGTNVLMQLHDGVHAHARVEPAVREAKPLRIPTNRSRKRCLRANNAEGCKPHCGGKACGARCTLLGDGCRGPQRCSAVETCGCGVVRYAARTSERVEAAVRMERPIGAGAAGRVARRHASTHKRTRARASLCCTCVGVCACDCACKRERVSGAGGGGGGGGGGAPHIDVRAMCFVDEEGFERLLVCVVVRIPHAPIVRASCLCVRSRVHACVCARVMCARRGACTSVHTWARACECERA